MRTAAARLQAHRTHALESGSLTLKITPLRLSTVNGSLVTLVVRFMIVSHRNGVVVLVLYSATEPKHGGGTELQLRDSCNSTALGPEFRILLGKSRGWAPIGVHVLPLD